jgi:type I restriction enzyme M protein
MAIKKSQLYSTLWKSCDELRGGMDASQYKDYILVILFVKYISDRFGEDEDSVIEVPKGETLGQGGSFQDMIYWKNKKEIGDEMNKIIGRLAEANKLKGIITVANFNDPDKLGKDKDMIDRLTNLIGLFENPALDFSKNRADGDDILGDAYEYLMMNFATESGKSKGQFYTPSEVSRILAKVVGIAHSRSQDETIYDPTCGSGSLLLKAADEAPHGITIYGQEKDNATRALAVMNMWLHGNPDAEIWQDNTLASPHFKNELGGLQTFNYIVANPPFSDKAWGNGFKPDDDQYQRFDGYGIPPSKNGDFAYLLHVIRSLKSKGKAAVILPHGVLFRGNAEAAIRTNLIKRGYIKGIIGLPANLFYGTGIPACIIIIDKELSDSRRGIFMMDTSKGFLKDGNKNRLREQDIHKIVDVFDQQNDFPKYARMVPYQEIEANEYNLNIPRYIDNQEAEDIQDIAAHLLGGIPHPDIDNMNQFWEVFPNLRKELFKPTDRPLYSQLTIAKEDIKTTIFAYTEFVDFLTEMKTIFSKWETKHTDYLKGLDQNCKPKKIIVQIAEQLINDYANKPLIDKYDMYQHIMNYWVATMKDDCYIISEDGWKAEVYLIYADNDKEKKKPKGWDCDLVPKDLVINRYFEKEKKAMQTLEATRDNYTQEKEELEEEHGGEDGLLVEVTNDKGSISKGEVAKRIKAIKNSKEDAEELAVLEKWLTTNDAIADTKKQIKNAEEERDLLLAEKYKVLTPDEIKTLVVDDKWMASLRQDIYGELDRVSQRLTQRISELADRYEFTLSEIEGKVKKISSKVFSHLEKISR